MKLVVTGAAGFLGWHVRCLLRARATGEVTTVDRPEWASADALQRAVADADVVLHLAGANRAPEAELRHANPDLVRALTAALDATSTRPRTVVHANSIHAGNGSAFGDGKAAAAEVLSSWGRRSGVPVLDLRLPNLFGEHGRPNYNSVVATFCHALATGGTPAVVEDRELPLLHVQDAARALLAAGVDGSTRLPEPRPLTVSALLARVTGLRDTYASGEIPDVRDPFDLALFNTYRSYTFPDAFPMRLRTSSDERGTLFESVRAGGGQAQVFGSTTVPGAVRGQHFHLRKIERFQVVRGRAQIAVRRLFGDEVVRFEVSSERPVVVDMPTMWTHSIRNTGDDELVTLFWTNELYRDDDPDTYREAVEPGVAA